MKIQLKFKRNNKGALSKYKLVSIKNAVTIEGARGGKNIAIRVGDEVEETFIENLLHRDGYNVEVIS